jgi:hypothetical protein
MFHTANICLWGFVSERIFRDPIQINLQDLQENTVKRISCLAISTVLNIFGIHNVSKSGSVSAVKYRGEGGKELSKLGPLE